MMSSLISNDQLTVAIANLATHKNVKQALQFFDKRREWIRKYESIEEFAFEAFEHDPNMASAVEHHLVAIRRAVVKELWNRQIFLSVNIIEELIFSCLIHEDNDVISKFAAAIVDNGLHHAGMVLYPLHSFGFLQDNIFSFNPSSSTAKLNLSKAGVSLTHQTNSVDRSISFLEDVRKRQGITQAVPRDLIQHYYVSRDLKWLKRNPLMAVKVTSYAGGRYENQRILGLKLRLSTALIAMVAVMGKTKTFSKEGGNASTSFVNNWQTLDIKHFLVFQANPNASVMHIDCVPIHFERVEMAELSDLGVDIDPAAWSDSKRRLLAKIRASLVLFEANYIKHCVVGAGNDHRTRLYRKLLTSLNYFRRSLRARGVAADNVVALAIAFETLLTDFYARGVTEKIHERIRKCLYRQKGAQLLCEAVRELFWARGGVVHLGDAILPQTIWLAHKAYVQSFIYVVAGLENISPREQHSITKLFD